MFIDASAIVAILAREPEAGALIARLDSAKARYTSALVVLEAAMVLSARLDIDPVLVEAKIQALLEEARIVTVVINGAMATRAVAIFAKRGEGRGHPARLTLGDCVSHAMAQAYRVQLLSRNGDLAPTDPA